MSTNLEFIKANPKYFLDNFPLSAFDAFDIFLSPAFMNIHSQIFSTHSFGCIETSSKKLIGIGHFLEIENGFFRSPGRGSYGGLQFSKEMEISDHLEFTKFVHNELLQLGARKIEITFPPLDYKANYSNEWINSWFQLDFKIDKIELNYAIILDKIDYHDKVVHAVRKRINKCRRENFTVAEKDASFLPEVYDVIKQNRESRGFPVTMTLEQIQETAAAMPERLKLFVVQSVDLKTVASAIVYQVNKDVDYVFYWGDLPGFSDYSFVTLLADYLYQKSLENKKLILDLGISTVNSIPNPGLVKFKTNLGAVASSKFIMKKTI